MSHGAGFLDLPLIRTESPTLNPYTYILARVLKSCKRTLRYVLYNSGLCELSHNLAKSFNINWEKDRI